MSVDFVSMANKTILSLQPYVAGKAIEEVRRELGLSHITKLASNENPAGPSPLVTEAIRRVAAEVALYPDDNAFGLKATIAQFWQLSEQQVTVGSGSNSLLDAIGRLFLNQDTSVIYSEHAFLLYEHAATLNGAAPLVAKMAAGYACDLRQMLSLVRDDTRLVFIANPNNPTGGLLTHAQLVSFLSQLPATCLVVLDEAYAEYVADETYACGRRLLADYDNLIVLRTFSKAYGLAGLRVGYALANAQITELLNRVRLPFNVSTIAQQAAIVALADQDHIKASCQANIAGLDQLEVGLSGLGYQYLSSVANFICFNAGLDAVAIAGHLLASGVIVRSVAEYKMPEYLRVSVGSAAQNSEFLTALAAWNQG